MDKLAFVTGASSGIGQAYAERLARDGWNLVVVARRRDRLDDLAARMSDEHGVEVHVEEADLSRLDDLKGLCEMAASLPVELLINNAALGHYMPFAQLAPEVSEELVHLNVLAPVRLTRSVLDGMREQGSGAIITVASLLAFSGSAEGELLPQRAVYAASKSFLVTFTQILASELKGSGVRMQVVCPGMVTTEFHSRQGLDMTRVDRMSAEDVVRASLMDLERGVVVSMPGVGDEHALDAVDEASRKILQFTRVTELPERYSEEG